MSSTVSLLSLSSSHRSNDMDILFFSNNNSSSSSTKDIFSYHHHQQAPVMEGNEYDDPTTGPPSPSSAKAGTTDRDEIMDIERFADQSQGNGGGVAAAAPLEQHPLATLPEPPHKKIKLEHDVATSASTKTANTSPPPTAVALPLNLSGDDEVKIGVDTQYDSPSAPAGTAAAAASTGQPSRSQDSHEGSTVVTSATDVSHQTGPSFSTNSSRDSLETGAAGAPALGPSVILPPAAAIAPAATAATDASPATAAAAPFKSLTFAHLNTKYLAELEYMLREFRKLERQLLGAKGAAQLEESAGSRERREKLHSFILHLEDTVRQIELGCKLEAEGKSAIAIGTSDSGSKEVSDASKKQLAQESALSHLTKEKEEEENVQKLEEHILANLLPVKVRLKKQLAAQQGATQNPAGMPSRRGSLQPPSAVRGKGTFAEAAEKRRKLAEEARLAAQEQHERTVRRVSNPTQFGKPLGGGGSSLTRNLHGSTLGSTQRIHGHGVGVATKPEDGSDGIGIGERKILYAGMVPGSTQQQSGLSAASGVHDVITTTHGDSIGVTLKEQNSATTPNAISTAQAHEGHVANKTTVPVESKPVQKPSAAPAASVGSGKPQQGSSKPSDSLQKKTQDHLIPGLSEDDQRKIRKNRRKKKLLRVARRQERERQKQQNPSQLQPAGNQAPTSNVTAVRKKPTHAKGQKKKGPRAVEYICALCSEAYNSTCDYNPWWALAQHECPKCRKSQIPRIDIGSPANAIEYHPALLAHIEDNGGNGGSNNATSSSNANQVIAAAPTSVSAQGGGTDVSNSVLDSESDTDLSELSDDDMSLGSLNSEESESDFQSMTPAEQAEHETFGSEYDGPFLSDAHSSRLLILMGHASTCPCQHRSSQHQQICKSTKYLMLHVRDCPGTTSTMDVCPFPWCRKVKHLLYHLVSCQDPETCPICSHKDVPKTMKNLIGLNSHRMKKHRQKLIAAAKASRAAMKAKASSSTKQIVATGTSGSKAIGTRKLVPVAPASSATAPPAKGGQASVAVNKESDNVSIQSADSNHRSDPSLAQTHQAMKVEEGISPPATSNVTVQANDTLTQSSSAAPSSGQAFVSDPTMVNADSTEKNDTGSPEDENDVLPTPISAMKMEEDDEEHAEVSELLAVSHDDHHADPIASPADVNVNSTVVVSESKTSNNGSSPETLPGRSSTGTPSISVPPPTTSFDFGASAVPAAPATSASSLMHANITTTNKPTTSESVAASSPASATPDVEKTAGPVEVN